MRSFFKVISVAAIMTAAPCAFAHYYSWIPGSSADSPPSANRMAIVNLHFNSLITPTDGFVFNPGSASADAIPPTFSPDGVFAYICTSGISGAAEQHDGKIYVYHANNTQHLLESGNLTPPMAQTVTIPSDNGASAIQPTGITMSPTFNKLIVTESRFKKVHIWDVSSGGANYGIIDESSLTTLTVPSAPSSAWINKTGTRAYFVTNQENDGTNVTVQPKVHVVDLTVSPAVELASVDVPSPAQGAGVFGVVKTVPVANCSFILKAGAQMITGQPPGHPNDIIYDDSILYIFSGYAGFEAKSLITGTVVLNDKFRVYKLDTATNTLTGDGNPLAEVTPGSAQNTFPPILSVYHTGHGSTLLQAAGTSLFEDGGSSIKVLTPNSDDYVLLNGMLDQTANFYWFGTIAAADAGSLITGTYTPVQTSAFFTRTSGHSIINATVAPLANGTTIDRSLVTVVGFIPAITPARPVIMATDGFFGLKLPSSSSETSTTAARKSKLITYNPSGTSGSSKITIDTNLVANAYVQQPVGIIPTTATQVANHLLGIERLDIGADINHDAAIDATDADYFVRSGP